MLERLGRIGEVEVGRGLEKLCEIESGWVSLREIGKG